MKTLIQKEVDLCDFCQINETPYTHCLTCGKGICYDCRNTNSVEMLSRVWGSSSNDGLYCRKCYHSNLISGGDELFKAYLEIRRLLEEHKAWVRVFTPRMKEAEENVNRLCRK
jgi:hypothetical protein